MSSTVEGARAAASASSSTRRIGTLAASGRALCATSAEGSAPAPAAALARVLRFAHLLEHLLGGGGPAPQRSGRLLREHDGDLGLARAQRLELGLEREQALSDAELVSLRQQRGRLQPLAVEPGAVA